VPTIITRNVLDCDQSNYSSRIIFSYTFTLEPNTNGTGWTVSEIWPYPRTKDEVDRMIHCPDMAIRNFPRRRPADILDLMQPEISPFDPPTSKSLPRIKYEVDRMTRCRDMAVRNFPKCEVRRSVGRRSSIIHCSHTLLFATRYVRNVAHEE